MSELIMVTLPDDNVWPDAAFRENDSGMFAIPVCIGDVEFPNACLVLTSCNAIQLAETLMRLVS